MKKIILKTIQLLIALFPLIVLSQTESFNFYSEMLKPNANFYEILQLGKDYFSNHPEKEEEQEEFYLWVDLWKSRVSQPNSKIGSFNIASQAFQNLINNPICDGASNVTSDWKSLGPSHLEDANGNPYQALGVVTAVAALPSDPNTVYAGSSNGGLFRTTNANAINPTWVNLTDKSRLPLTGIGDILIDPTLNINGFHTIYICYGHQRWDYYGIGVLKSIDDGNSWIKTDLNYNYLSGYLNVKKLMGNPSNNNTIFAITNNEVFKTICGGKDVNGTGWPSLSFKSTVNNSDVWIKDIEMDRANSDHIYVGGNQIWRFDDAGQSWSRLDDLPTFFTPNTPSGLQLTEIKFSICGIQNGLSALIDFKFVRTIPPISETHILEIETYDELSSTWNSNKITNDWGPIFIVSPTQSNVMYIGDDVSPGQGRAVSKSVNGGNDFYQVTFYNAYYNGTFTHADVRALKLIAGTSDPLKPNGDDDFIICGNDGGILFSQYSWVSLISPPSTWKTYISWRNINGYGLNITQIYGISGTELNYNYNVMGTQDNGNFQYLNSQWKTDVKCDAYECVIDPNNNSIVYSQKDCGLAGYTALWNSITNGLSFNVSSAQTGEYRGAKRPMQVNKVNGEYYIAYHNVFHSPTPVLDFTLSNSKISDFSNSFYGVQNCETINAMDVNSINPDIIYIAFDNPTFDADLNTCNINCQPLCTGCPTCTTSTACTVDPVTSATSCPVRKKLFKTTDGGINWVDKTDVGSDQVADLFPCKWFSIRGLAMNPDNADEVYVVFDGFWKNTSGAGIGRVMRSLDGGNTWVDYSTGLHEFPVNCIVFQKGVNALYIGTDIGVFYRKTDDPNSHWECFNHNLPICSVTDLEINYCAQKIRAGTYGRGLWESDLPITLITEHVSSSTTWSSRELITDLIIDPNISLTITGTITIAKGKKIKISPGATLILNGGTLTNGCGLMWQGIEVVGDKLQSQYTSSTRGKVIMINGATISNAKNAITLWDGNWNHTGGIIQASNSHFLNNRRSVEFMSYHNFFLSNHYQTGNLSSFANCDFIINDNYPDPNYPFMTHITMWDVEGIWISNCRFENNRTNVTSTNQLGTGIGTADAGFYVVASCDIIPPIGSDCPESNTHRSLFKGLEYGIYARTASTNKPVYVDKADFVNNINGIWFSSINYATVTRCNLRYGANTTPMTNPLMHGGLGINTGTGFRVEENQFLSNTSSGSGITNYGTYVNNTGPDNNYIYKNEYIDLTIGNFARGRNRNNNSTPSGLQYFCNTNSNISARDFTITRGVPQNSDDGISTTQGDLNNSAGNTFSQLGNQSNGDFGNYTNWPVIYYHTGGNTVPIYYTASLVIPTISNTANSCLSHFTNSDTYPLSSVERQSLTSDFNTKQKNYLNLLYNYNNLIDGGDQNALLSHIEQSWSEDAWTLRSELLAEAPYLSENVLRGVASQNILPEAMFLEVCLANPDGVRNMDFIEFLRNEVNPPISEVSLSIIQASWDAQSLRTNLEASIVKLGKELLEINSKLVNHFYGFALEAENSVDSIEFWMSRMNTINSLYSLAEIKLSKGEYQQGKAILDSMPLLFTLRETSLLEWQRYKSYYEFRVGIMELKNLLQLNESEISSLQIFANASDDLPGTMARNLLCFGYGYCNNSGPTLDINLYRLRSPKQSTLPELVFSIIPNPANSYASINYKIENQDDLEIHFFNMLGISIDKIILKNGSGSSIWDTRAKKSGLYFYKVIHNGNLLKSGKIEITH